MMIKHLYVHVPFCNSICSYCDFARTAYRKDRADLWLDVLEKELKLIDTDNEQYETVYLGGGTPSSLNYDQLRRLLLLLDPYTDTAVEYTLEANPESLDDEKIALLKEYGINRVSLGVQSTDCRLLKLMNRHHDLAMVSKRIEELKRNGIYNISVDLMYSLPTQTMDDLEKSISDILDLGVTHVSLYSLTVEENSVFGKLGYESLDQDVEADMYEYIENRLNDAGFVHYEVANFALPGYESKHNKGYWKYEDFRGVSCGSSSKISHRRYTITRNLERYLSDMTQLDEEVVLSKTDEMFEHIMMSLRMSEGLDIERFNSLYGTSILDHYRKAIDSNRHHLTVENGHLICTNLEMLNEILLDFMD